MSLEREFRQVAAELELCSCGTTVSYDSSGGGESDRFPTTGDPDPPHLRYREAWRRASTVEQMGKVIADARAELKAIQKSTPPAKLKEQTKGDRDREICALPSGFSPAEVSLKFKCSETEVRKARLGGGLHQESGDPLLPDVGSTAEKIAALAARGLTQAQIAVIVKVDQSTVSRQLRGSVRRAA